MRRLRLLAALRLLSALRLLTALKLAVTAVEMPYVLSHGVARPRAAMILLVRRVCGRSGEQQRHRQRRNY